MSVAPPTQGTWRSKDYVNAVRLVDAWFSMKWVVELFIYTFRWSTQTCATTLAITSPSHSHHIPNITFPATYVATMSVSVHCVGSFSCKALNRDLAMVSLDFVEFFIPPRLILYLIFFYGRKESASDGSRHRRGVSTGKTQHRVRVRKKWKVVIVAGESAT